MTKEVESQIESAMLSMESRLIKAVREIVKESNENLEKMIKTEYDIRLEFFDRELQRSFVHHEEHFKALELIKKRLDLIDGVEDGECKAEAKSNTSLIATLTIIGIVLTAAGIAIGTVI